MKIISILNQKGGSGKTTLTTNLADALKRQGLSVLIVDSDPQGSARDWNNETNGDIVPVIGLDRPSLAKDIKAISGKHDIILIDGAPQLSQQMSAAILVSDVVLIPVQPSPYDLWATADLVSAVKQRQELGADLKVFFIISRAIKNTKLAGEIKAVVAEYELPVFNAGTTQRIAYASSAAGGQTVFHTSDKAAQQEINKVAIELLEQIQ